MSPEQFFDPKKVDGRSDLWSVAVVAYRALTGQHPSRDHSQMGALFSWVRSANFPMPSEFCADIPPEVDAWFQKALRREPAERFPTALEMASELDRAIRGQATTTLKSLVETTSAPPEDAAPAPVAAADSPAQAPPLNADAPDRPPSLNADAPARAPSLKEEARTSAAPQETHSPRSTARRRSDQRVWRILIYAALAILFAVVAAYVSFMEPRRAVSSRSVATSAGSRPSGDAGKGAPSAADRPSPTERARTQGEAH
jgi:serine/threonine protein kinase